MCACEGSSRRARMRLIRTGPEWAPPSRLSRSLAAAAWKTLGGPFVPIQSEPALAGGAVIHYLHRIARLIRCKIHPTRAPGGSVKSRRSSLAPGPLNQWERWPGSPEDAAEGRSRLLCVELRNAAGTRYQECPSPSEAPLFWGEALEG